MHIKSCREIDSAVDTALKKHKILIAKKEKEKAASIAARRDLAAQASQTFPDDHEMDVDSNQEVQATSIICFYLLSYVFYYRIFYCKITHLSGRLHHLQGLQAGQVDEFACHIATVTICRLKLSSFLFRLRYLVKMIHHLKIYHR